MSNLTIHPHLREIAQIFNSAGYSLYLVGGAVRDIYLGTLSNDIDLATNARPEMVMKLFKRVIPTGLEHGTVTIRYKGFSYETTTFRTESDYSDGRRPDSVEFTSNIEDDLSRRDFTINAIAIRLPDGVLVDPYAGIADISKKLIRCVGDPLERFMEDGLRPLRAVRFSAQLEFQIHPDTFNAISMCLSRAKLVAPERIQIEINKILSSRKPSVAFRLMEKAGLLALFLPELLHCRGVEQKGFHIHDVLDHLYATCDAAPQDSLILRLAALFHDIGKPAVKSLNSDGIPSFHGHEKESSKIASRILSRLRYSNEIKERVIHLIEQHMFYYQSDWTDAAVRRFIARVGLVHLADLFDLRRADQFGIHGKLFRDTGIEELQARIALIRENKDALKLKDLAINGNDLLSLGLKPGKRLGVILNELLETVLDDPSQNTKEQLLLIASNLIAR